MSDFEEMREYHRKRREQEGWSNPPSPKTKPKPTQEIKEGTLATISSEDQYRVIGLFKNSPELEKNLDPKTKEFFLDMSKKFADFGTNMFISEKQLKYLLSIATKNKR